MKKPNVILVTSHDTGTHFGCCGDRSVKTPNIDRIASQGALFTDNFCTTPLCSPSRGSIITGRYPVSNGLMGLVNRGWDMPDTERSLPHYLEDAGYSTYLFGFQHERTDPAKSGYENIARTNGVLCREVIDAATQFVSERKDKKPFFAAIGFFETHLPFNNTRYKGADPEKVWVPPYLVDCPEIRSEVAKFHGLVREVDDNAGKLADAVKKAGLEENTVFIYTVDHGIGFPGAKSTLYDPGIKTAFMVKWPAVIPEGTVISRLTSNIDLLPTLLDLLDIPADRSIQGRSLVPLFNCHCDPDAVSGEAIYAQKDWHDCYDPKRCVRTREFKYIRNFEKGPMLVLPEDILNSPAAKHVHERFKGQRPAEELYDLKKDPDEFNNVAQDPGYAQAKKQLRASLDSWMLENNDYLRGMIVTSNK